MIQVNLENLDERAVRPFNEIHDIFEFLKDIRPILDSYFEYEDEVISHCGCSEEIAKQVIHSIEKFKATSNTDIEHILYNKEQVNG